MRNNLLLMIVVHLFFVASAFANSAHYQMAIDDASRLAEHRARDPHRLPHAILSLTGLKPGDTVVDLAVGSGYYAALFSRVVGPQGKVFAVDPTLIFEFFPQAKGTFNAIQSRDPMPNVHYSVQRMDSLKVSEQADLVMMALYYHDTLWTGENRSKMNQAIFNALKPGGRFVVLDHHAFSGAGADIGKSLHRMDAAMVVPEVTKAGFVLAEQSDVLRNQRDPRTFSVFDEAWRGHTDRFIFVFQKPLE